MGGRLLLLFVGGLGALVVLVRGAVLLGLLVDVLFNVNIGVRRFGIRFLCSNEMLQVSEVNCQCLGGVISARKHHAMQQLMNRQRIILEQLSRSPSQILSNAASHNIDVYFAGVKSVFIDHFQNNNRRHYLSQTSNLSTQCLLLRIHNLPSIQIHHDPAPRRQVRSWIVQIEVLGHDLQVVLVR